MALGNGGADRNLRVRLPEPPRGIDPLIAQWMSGAVRALSNADELRTQPLARGYTISGTFTETRSLNFDTATMDEMMAFLCTLIVDLQRAGAVAG